jgi:hypothetical protein
MRALISYITRGQRTSERTLITGAQANSMDTTTRPGPSMNSEDTRQQLSEVLAAYAKSLDPADPQGSAALAAIEEFNASSAHPVQGDGDANVALLILAAINHIKGIERNHNEESRHRAESVAFLQEKGDLSGL